MYSGYTIFMTTIQTIIQTIWASILTLGWGKLLLAVIIIAILTRVQKLLGLVGAILFIAYLANWL